jgi:methyl-accepting chemotaxis protein
MSTLLNPTSHDQHGDLPPHELASLWNAVNRVQAVIEFSLTGHVLTANDNFLRVMGYRIEDVTGQHHRLFCTPEFARSADYREFWRQLGEGEFMSGEFKRIAKDGGDVWLQASYNPVFDGQGQVVKVVKFATDITAQKALSAEYAAQVKAMNRVQAIIEFDLTGRILTANDNFLAATGYELEEIQGKHHRIFCDPELAKSIGYRDFWQRLGRGEVDEGVYRRRDKDGHEIWLQASYNPVFNADGRIVKIMKFATDITAAKLRETDFAGKVAAIERAQAVIEFDLAGNVLTANGNFLTLLGYTIDEVRGQHHRMFCDDEYVRTQEYCEFWGALSRGEFQSGRFMRRGKFGQDVWIRAIYNPIFDLDGSVSKIVKFATDVTDHVRREADLAEKAAAMSATVSELLASIRTIAASTHQSTELAMETQESAATGSAALEKLLDAMAGIQRSSTEIEEIVKVIGELAGQTNLLAFNAAIEAARAGEQGVGFSVVAEEVRRLAEKSAQAAREINRLINASVESATNGHESSLRAVDAFRLITAGVGKTTQSISAIDHATAEQERSAERVAELIRHLEAMHGDRNSTPAGRKAA